jgi:ubiquinone/menaquinone biosynthesis C-methylase UbiE
VRVAGDDHLRSGCVIARAQGQTMADTPGAEQAGIAGVFNRAAETYDRVGPQFFTHFGRWLVDRADVAPGAHLLDVAAGRGAVLFPAARQAGPGGSVFGIDLSAGMVERTQADIGNAGWPNVTMRQMDATRLDFPDASFDRVLCGFGVFFFPHPHHALLEFFRVLKPGGRVAVSTWTRDCAFLTWVRRELAASAPPSSRPGPISPDAPRFDTAEQLEAALQQAGFVDIEIDVEHANFVYVDDEQWWQSVWSHGIRQRIEGLDAPALARVKADMLRKVQAMKQADGIHNHYSAYCAMGTKPGA